MKSAFAWRLALGAQKSRFCSWGHQASRLSEQKLLRVPSAAQRDKCNELCFELPAAGAAVVELMLRAEVQKRDSSVS
jgi:hypothetical protein